LPPPVADKGNDGAGRNTEQCEALQASSATMFLTDSGSAKRIFSACFVQEYNLQFNINRGVVARALPPPVADKGNDGAGRNTEQCEVLQASSATMFLTDSGSAKRIFFSLLCAGIQLII